jgi:hypothetical protein
MLTLHKPSFTEEVLTSKCRSEEGDMGSLIIGDFFQVVVEGLIETSVFKVLESKVGKALTVELVLYNILDQINVQYRCDCYSPRCSKVRAYCRMSTSVMLGFGAATSWRRVG